MNDKELLDLSVSGAAPELSGLKIASIDGRLSIDGRIAIPIEAFDSSISQVSDIDIEDDIGNAMGVLCFCRQLGEVDLRSLSDWQRVAYLSEVSSAEYNQPYRFQRDYVVLESIHLATYLAEFFHSAPLWGGFTHRPLPSATSLRVAPKITAFRGISLPTPHHQSSLQRAIFSSHSFDRYLRMYHQIELLFDWVVVKQIQALGTNLTGIGKLMSDYAASDTARLKNIINNYCTDTSRLTKIIFNLPSFLPTAEVIFQGYSKESNPLKDKDRWQNLSEWIAKGTPDLAGAKRFHMASDQQRYDELIRNLATYWIYRIRCCIAHNRIGEYIIQDSDENLVINFIEPLLREVLFQVLSNTTAS